MDCGTELSIALGSAQPYTIRVEIENVAGNIYGAEGWSYLHPTGHGNHRIEFSGLSK